MRTFYYLSIFKPNGNKSVLLTVFLGLFALSENLFKSSEECNLKRFTIFSNEKYFTCFVIGETKTCTAGVCHKSVYKMKHSQASAYSGF